MCRIVVFAIALLASVATHAQPVVTNVSWPSHPGDRQVRLGDSVWVRVSSLDALRKIETDTNKRVTLWIDGRDTKVPAEGFNHESNWVRFRLDRHDDNRELWSDLLHDPFNEPRREIMVSVGVHAPLAAAPGANMRVTLVKVVPLHALLWSASFLLLVAVFVWVARRTDILRNGPRYDDGSRQPYSLGRVQMGWWFILILVGFVAIERISGDAGSITPSLLALLGISAGTALGASVIESTASPREEILAKIAAAKAALQTTPNDPASTAEVASLERRLAGFRSENWLYDILKDHSGAVALHRLQIVVWTIVLGVMFIATVSVKLTMPEFSATLLALMGISGGTYIGFKLPGATQGGG